MASISNNTDGMAQQYRDREIAEEMRRKLDEYKNYATGPNSGWPPSMNAAVQQVQKPPKPLPPAVKAKSDAIMKQREELKQKFKEQDQQLMEQRALVECGIEVGSTLVGQDGEEATVVWIQPRSDGYNVVLRVTTAKTIAPTQIGDYWTVAETPKEVVK